MTNQSIIDKLIEMRLTTMADAFRNQLNDSKFKEVPFEDRFGMLVDIEYSNRKFNIPQYVCYTSPLKPHNHANNHLDHNTVLLHQTILPEFFFPYNIPPSYQNSVICALQ